MEYTPDKILVQLQFIYKFCAVLTNIIETSKKLAKVTVELSTRKVSAIKKQYFKNFPKNETLL